MNELEFRQRVHDLLDDRRDPVDDPDVQSFLLAHPELLDEFATMRDGLRSLAQAPTRARRRRVPWAAAGAVLCLLGLAWVITRPFAGAVPDFPVPDLAPDGRILSVDVTIVEHDGRRTIEHRIDKGCFAERRIETVTYVSKTIGLEICTTTSATTPSE